MYCKKECELKARRLFQETMKIHRESRQPETVEALYVYTKTMRKTVLEVKRRKI